MLRFDGQQFPVVLAVEEVTPHRFVAFVASTGRGFFGEANVVGVCPSRAKRAFPVITAVVRPLECETCPLCWGDLDIGETLEEIAVAQIDIPQ